MKTKKIFQKLLLAGSCAIGSICYAGPSDPQWDYFGPIIGQSKWGELPSLDALAPIPDLYPYAGCGLGQKQSPIDIRSTNAIKNSHVNNIRFSYNNTPLFVNKNEHALLVDMPPSQNNKNELYIGKQEYELKQLVFHAPSEHAIDGQRSKMEIQFVHTTPSGKLAIVGVLVTVNAKGKDNSEFQEILDLAYDVASKNSYIKPSKLLPGKKSNFYTYAGSLTAPPCTEGVDWYVLRYPLEISAAQITAFEGLYAGNVRDTQNLKRRIVIVEKNFK
jgi:carbonic anhydrase